MAELFSFGSHGFRNSFGLLRYYYNDMDKISTNRVINFVDSEVSPEKSIKLVNEFDISDKKNELKFTLFSNYILNYVFERPIGLFGTIRGPMPYFVFDQMDVLFIGSDITLKRKFSKKFKTAFTFNYLWSNNLDNSGKLINQPPIRIKNDFNWQINNFWNIDFSEISISPSYVFRQFNAPITYTPESLINGEIIINYDTKIFDFKEAPDGYFLVDFSWKIDIKDFTLTLFVNNIFNKKYRNYLNNMRYFADDMGRNFIFNLSYKFNGKD